MAERGLLEALAVSVFAFRSIDPASYERHELHRTGAAWGEKNCYIDVWIEVLSALGLDPYACLPFVLAVDFEGDQWTFFKPPHEDLAELYGLDVQELNVWRPLLEHAEEQLAGRKLVLTEADSFYLPDTAGTDYRQNHVKTTIAIQELDAAAQKLRYFHNGGYFELAGDDFVRTFRVGAPHDPTFLPLFAELVRLSRVKALPGDALAKRSIALLCKHLARRPSDNPTTRFRERFPRDLAWMKSEGLGAYHAHAFAHARQLGAAFELAALYLRWLERHGERDLEPIAAQLMTISDNAKSLILKTARAVSAKREVDFAPMFDAIERAWEGGMTALASRYGGG